MFIRFTTLLAISVFATSANAGSDNCGLTKLDFGINQEKLKSSFKLDVLDVSTTGEAVIISGAREVCKDIPENANVEFGLIDDKFVQIRIINQGATGELFKYATEVFGERDNKEKNPSKAQHDNTKIKLGLWGKNDSYNVVYTSYVAGGRDFERLIITSLKHQNLFDDANKTKSQAADDYLKENKLGIYSPDYKELPDAGKDNLQKLKDNYDDKASEKHKKLKENENTRGYHYGN